jgi:hypothetical protein
MNLELPDRVEIDIALKVASSYALPHFVIPKFPNIFVYREKSNKIFYMKLFGKTVSVGDSIPSSSDTDSEFFSGPGSGVASGPPSLDPPLPGLAPPSNIISISPRINRNSSDRDTAGSGGPGSASGPGSIASAGGGGGGAGGAGGGGGAPGAGRKRQVLIMRVFGVDQPGEEITIHLRLLLQRKLEEYLLTTLSQNLLRNPKLKLTTGYPGKRFFFKIFFGSRDSLEFFFGFP